MKQSQIFIPTLKEIPSDAEAKSHQLMLRGGFIRQVSAGIYAYLPLAVRVLHNIEQIVREEMEQIDAIEMLAPAILPGELWQESGRYATYGDNLFKLKDRHERNFILGPTHEETLTYLIRDQLNSYKKMPKILYQIQAKYRDEDRPRYGLLRGREFIMKDGYSFSANQAQLDDAFNKMEQAYINIFNRCALDYRIILGDSGDMGGNASKEFSAVAEIGEDTIVYSDSSDYAANLEMAQSIIQPNPQETAQPLQTVATPHTPTVESVAAFLKVTPKQVIKSRAYVVDEQPVLVLIRGDSEVNETKLKNVLNAQQDVQMATDEQVETVFHSVAGFMGPFDLPETVKIVADSSLKGLCNGVTGANQKDLHWQNVNLERDLHLSDQDFVDVRTVQPGELSPDHQGSLQFTRGIEIGHIFKLGTRYSESLKATFLDENGRQQPVIMGSYGIGISRLLSAIVEQHCDDAGIIWPWQLAPYQVHVVIINTKDEDQMQLASEVEDSLQNAGFSVLVDDRSERPGVKFAEADLIGSPVRITVGKKASDKILEIKLRNQTDSVEVNENDLIDSMKILLKNY